MSRKVYAEITLMERKSHRRRSGFMGEIILLAIILITNAKNSKQIRDFSTFETADRFFLFNLYQLYYGVTDISYPCMC